MKIELQGEKLELLPQKALYWPDESLLALSDVHFGKAESFQSFGVAVPSAVNDDNFERIESLIRERNIKEILVLGDWIHGQRSWTPELFSKMRMFLESHSLVTWTLLLGNHERGSIEHLRQLPFAIHEGDLSRGPFLFSHGHGASGKNQFAIQGHVHPVVLLKHGPVNLRLSCFCLDQNSLTLPSFGAFTGGHPLETRQGRRIFAIAGADVFEVPPPRD